MQPKKHLLEPGWVYVVDDSEAARKYAEWHLRRLGWRVFTFPDAASVVIALGTYAPEAMLLDIGLPDGSGHVIASRIRRNTATARMRLVAYTGLGTEDRSFLPEAGFDEVLAKPGLAADFERLLPSPAEANALPAQACSGAEPGAAGRPAPARAG